MSTGWEGVIAWCAVAILALAFGGVLVAFARSIWLESRKPQREVVRMMTPTDRARLYEAIVGDERLSRRCLELVASARDRLGRGKLGEADAFLREAEAALMSEDPYRARIEWREDA